MHLAAGAQKVHLNVLGGFSNYQGDLQSARLTFNNIKPAFGAGLYYEVTEKLYIRGQVVFAKVTGADSTGTTVKKRNLSFSSPVTEFHLAIEYDLLNVYEHGWAPYLFAGIGFFKFNPSAKDSLGNKVYLQPLGTEGQGFYNGRTKYALSSMVIPFGGGLKFALNDNTMLRLEAGLRKTSTDYLDDVSTTYADRNDLLINNGAKAVEMAFRGDELKPPLAYPGQGITRGSPRRTDYYYIVGASVSFRINNANSGGSKNGLGCPVRVL
ncbi:MAG: hypothetical protein RL172_1248 [Bacteroidota bacterium]